MTAIFEGPKLNQTDIAEFLRAILSDQLGDQHINSIAGECDPYFFSDMLKKSISENEPLIDSLVEPLVADRADDMRTEIKDEVVDDLDWDDVYSMFTDQISEEALERADDIIFEKKDDISKEWIKENVDEAKAYIEDNFGSTPENDFGFEGVDIDDTATNLKEAIDDNPDEGVKILARVFDSIEDRNRREFLRYWFSELFDGTFSKDIESVGQMLRGFFEHFQVFGSSDQYPHNPEPGDSGLESNMHKELTKISETLEEMFDFLLRKGHPSEKECLISELSDWMRDYLKAEAKFNAGS